MELFGDGSGPKHKVTISEGLFPSGVIGEAHLIWGLAKTIREDFVSLGSLRANNFPSAPRPGSGWGHPVPTIVKACQEFCTILIPSQRVTMVQCRVWNNVDTGVPK